MRPSGPVTLIFSPNGRWRDGQRRGDAMSPYGHACSCGTDHHSGGYTPGQRADLDLVLAFNRRLAGAIDECRDISATEKLLDPDPLRYMWVDEGGGRLREFIGRADEALAGAERLPEHRRLTGGLLPGAL